MVILVIFAVDRNYMMIIFVCARENQKYDYVLHLEARIFSAAIKEISHVLSAIRSKLGRFKD